MVFLKSKLVAAAIRPAGKVAVLPGGLYATYQNSGREVSSDLLGFNDRGELQRRP